MPEHHFTVTLPKLFSPSAEAVYNPSSPLGGRGNLQCKQNPSPKELTAGIYKPRLTLNRRMNHHGSYEITLRIELSLPKLLYGNNFEELTDSDLPAILTRLTEALASMGVHTTEAMLSQTLVSSVHYGKNFALSDHATPSLYLAELAKTEVTRRLDVNRTDFRNGGHSWKIHANSFEVTFYDKIKDLQKAKVSEKRAVEKDNQIQLGLLTALTQQPDKRHTEVLRMEVRLGARVKIRSMLKQLGVSIEPTFEGLFRNEIAQKVLLYYLDTIDNQRLKPPTAHNSDPVLFLATLRAKHSNITACQALAMYGYATAIQHLDASQMRNAIDRFGAHAWRSVKRQIETWGYDQPTGLTFAPLRQAIEAGKPLRGVAFIPEMINNDKYTTSKPSYANHLLQH